MFSVTSSLALTSLCCSAVPLAASVALVAASVALVALVAAVPQPPGAVSAVSAAVHERQSLGAGTLENRQLAMPQ